MSTFCEGCGQPAISATKAGRPICPDCISEGYGDEEQPTAAPDLAAENQRLRAEVEALREALSFYARENSWKSCGMYMSGRPNPSSAEIDAGNKARTALTRKAPQ